MGRPLVENLGLHLVQAANNFIKYLLNPIDIIGKV